MVDDAPALVIAWSAREPHRVGEVALLDVAGPWVLGRASGELAQLAFVRQRPHASIITGGLAGDSLSRRQIEIERAHAGLSLRNVGNARMRVNGADAISEVVVDGDVVEVVGHYVFYVTTRPVSPGDAFDWAAYPFGEADSVGIVGESPAAWKLRADLAFAAMTNAHVLIHGPSGTGKELCAAAIHSLSPRARRPFIALSAANIPPGLIDSELFGHPKNYPNAGMPERIGLVGAADGGTLFLDEIGEMPPELQAHLLRFLDARGKYNRLGETLTRHANVRLVCATNRGPAGLKFDLLARLMVRIQTPSLEARREDIPLIVRHLLRASPSAAAFANDVDPSLMVKLLRMRFPTNVRELEEHLVRALRFSAGSPPLRLVEPRGVVPAPPEDERMVAEIRAALERHGWHVSRAAESLGMSRHALARLMKKHGIRE
ncbi:MAG TPA: sigma 54-interacting transcriptional regulator [Polyangiaceae bacterium]